MIEEIPFITLAISAVIASLLVWMAYRAIRYGGAVGVLHGANAELVGKAAWEDKHALMGVGVHRLSVKGKQEQDVIIELIIASSSTPLTVPREHVSQVIGLLQKATSAP